MATNVTVTTIQTNDIRANDIQIAGNRVLTTADLSSLMPKEYTINGKKSENGSFTLDAVELNAAAKDHTHMMSDIDHLAEYVDSFSERNHTHEMVEGITVNGNTLTGEVMVAAGPGCRIDDTPNSMRISTVPYEFNSAKSFNDAATNEQIQMFVGTEEEWNAFTKQPNVKYVVMIKD